MPKMFRIRFRYADKWTKGEWVEMVCVMSSVEYCERIYGPNAGKKDCKFEILEVEELDEWTR